MKKQHQSNDQNTRLPLTIKTELVQDKQVISVLPILRITCLTDIKQYQHKMYNQALENYQLTKPTTHKYSLRQKMAQHKNKHEMALPPNASKLDLTSKNNNNMCGEYISHPKQDVSQWEKVELENHKINCFETVKQTLQINRFTSVAYLGNHRTASTTPSLEYQLGQPIRMEKQSVKCEGQTKYSLKNTRKNQRHQSIARPSQGGFHRESEQNLFTDNYSQPMSTEQHPHQDFESQQGKKSKYSLKNKNKKAARIDILLNLKYSDLSKPLAKQQLNQSEVQFKNSTNVFSSIKSKLFCGNGRSAAGGCTCQPRCIWIDKWMKIVKEPKWTDEGRTRDQKQFQTIIRQIQRDLPRTQPDHPTFNTPQMLEMLNQVLIGYASADYEVGYVQGMNFVASSLVYHSCNTYNSLKIMNHLMKNTGMRRLFKGDLSFGRKIAQKLNQDLRRLSYELHTYLIEEGIDLEMFASSWYFSLCGSFVPLDAMHHFIDKFIKKGFTGINQLLITLLLKLGDKILSSTDTQLMLLFSNQKLSQFSYSLDWEEIRSRSDRLLLPLIQI